MIGLIILIVKIIVMIEFFFPNHDETNIYIFKDVYFYIDMINYFEGIKVWNCYDYQENEILQY